MLGTLLSTGIAKKVGDLVKAKTANTAQNTTQSTAPTNQSLQTAPQRINSNVTGAVNNMYDNLLAGADRMYDADKKIAAQNYNQYRNEASVNAARSMQGLREQMASQGLFKSGDNVTGQLSINNQRSGDIAKFNQGEQNTYDKIAQSIQQKKMEIEAQRAQALIQAMQREDDVNFRNQQFDYQKGRDTVGDQRWQSQFDYQKGRDTIGDNRYKDQFDYQKSQDLQKYNQWLQDFNRQGDWRNQDNDWRNTQFDYQKSRDQIGDQRWEKEFALNVQRANAARSGGSGSGSSGTPQKYNNTNYKNDNQKSIYDYAMGKGTKDDWATRMKTLYQAAEDPELSPEDRAYANSLGYATRVGNYYDGAYDQYMKNRK